MAFVIFGARGVERTSDSGTFFCPRCGGVQPYERKTVRRRGTLFFIPVLPLHEQGEYVECQTCKGTFKPEILDYDPETAAAEVEAEYFCGIRRVAVHMMCADGRVEAAEVESVQDIFRELTGGELSEETIREEARALGARSEKALLQYLTDLSGRLNDHGKEMVVKCALWVASADARFEGEEKTLVFQIGQALGMSRAQVRDVIRKLFTQPEPDTWH
jgi:tellurite resistance protein